MACQGRAVGSVAPLRRAKGSLSFHQGRAYGLLRVRYRSTKGSLARQLTPWREGMLVIVLFYFLQNVL